MHLGVFTISTQVLFIFMKGLGLLDAVSWGWVFAPAFFHAGGYTVLYLQYRAQKKMIEAFAKEFGFTPGQAVAFKIPVEEATAEIVDIEKARKEQENDDTIH